MRFRIRVRFSIGGRVRVSFFGSFRVRVRFWLGPGTSLDPIKDVSTTVTSPPNFDHELTSVHAIIVT